MAPKQRYRLKLSKLDFISAVDKPAQETATALLIKRAPGDTLALTAKVAKVDEGLGLVFGWAFTSSVDGADYFDLQGDAIDQEFVKAAAEFMQNGGLTDEMHDDSPDGRVVFCMPMTPEIAKAFGVVTKTVGLMVAIKPSADVLAKFKSGEYSGFSIAGAGDRTAVKRDVDKAQWSVAMIDDLPDNSFLYVEPGGKKDDAGKTTPRSLRHFPYKDENGKVDVDHLRNAISRIPQSSLAPTLRNKLQVRAEKILAAQHTSKRFAGVAKQVVLTDEVDGHQHAIDLDDPAGWCGDRLSTSYATMEGADCGHSHAWTFDETSGAVTIAADSGHTHTVDGVVPPEVLAAFALTEQAESKATAARVLQTVLDGDASAGTVSVSVAARAPDNKSTRSDASPSVNPQPETKPMNFAKMLTAILAMTASQQAYVAKLAPDEVEPFFTKTAAERDAIMKAADDADPVVFKGEVTGIEVRKSHGDLALKLAKDNEALKVEQKAQAEVIAKRELEIEKTEIRSLAKAHLGNLAGGDEVHDYIVRSIRKGGGDKDTIEKALTAMKGWNALSKSKPAGIDGGSDTTPVSKQDAYEALAKGLNAFVVEKKLDVRKAWTEGLDAFVQTETGAALKGAYDAFKAAGN